MRKKIFGMIAVPVDRNEKANLLFRARCLMRATEKGQGLWAGHRESLCGVRRAADGLSQLRIRPLLSLI